MSDEVDEVLKCAAEHLHRCQLCPRDCGVNRTAGEKGYCGLDDKAHCFREMLHRAEEAELTPSHQLYFTGCNLRCEFCSVAEWNAQPLTVRELELDWVVRRIEERQRQGARNVNLLGGEPVVSLPGILKLMGRLRNRTPVVLNSNMYYNTLVDGLLRPWVTVYLADLKCGNGRCAKALLDASDYVEVARRNVLRASEHSSLIVRHLVLPGHAECCLRPTLKWLAAEIPGVKLSLRRDYVPPAEAIFAPPGYTMQPEMTAAVDYAQELGLNLIQ